MITTNIGNSVIKGSIIKAIPLVAHAMDEALVALVSAHQQYRNGIQKGIEKGNTK